MKEKKDGMVFVQIEGSMLDWERDFKSFLETLQNSFCEFFFAYWPEMEAHRSKIGAELKALAYDPAYECYMTYFAALIKKEGSLNLTMPEKMTRENAEQQLQKILDERADSMEDPEAYVQSYWKDYLELEKMNQFYVGLHDVVKEVVAGFYAAKVAEFSGDRIRELDVNFYHLGALGFGKQAMAVKSRVEGKQQSDL